MAEIIIVKEGLFKQFPFCWSFFEEISASLKHVEKMLGTKYNVRIPGNGKCDRSIHIKNKDHCLSEPYGWIWVLKMDTENI